MKRQRLSLKRRGTTTVESAIVLGTVLLIMFTILDLGLAVSQYNVLAGTAGAVARAAIVHGSTASPQLTAWGPTQWTGTAADSSEIAAVAVLFLGPMAAQDVTITVTWPDASNQAGSRVTVQLSYNHRTFSQMVGTSAAIPLQASCTLSIVH
jgi:Flp pilus assembly protein TadG